MVNIERVVLLVSVVVVGLALSLLLDRPFSWLLAAVLAILVSVGADHIYHSHWRIHLRRKRYTMTLWVLPVLLTLGSFLFLRLPVFSSGLAVVVGLLVTAALLTTTIASQYHTIDPDDPLQPKARFALNLLAYLIAFELFAAIYSTKARAMMSASAVFAISTMISLELLRGTERSIQRTWLYAAVIGLILAEMSWALNYWIISGMTGGLLLLLTYYLVTGIVQSHLLGHLNRRLLAEFAFVVVLGLVLVMTSGLWLQTA
ncbi:MAG: hypothetical protein M1358_05445 [Chloroflexi bacterium]|nr:hypothetical protein [Chloroflexota bacterium]